MNKEKEGNEFWTVAEDHTDSEYQYTILDVSDGAREVGRVIRKNFGKHKSKFSTGSANSGKSTLHPCDQAAKEASLIVAAPQLRDALEASNNWIVNLIPLVSREDYKQMLELTALHNIEVLNKAKDFNA